MMMMKIIIIWILAAWPGVISGVEVRFGCLAVVDKLMLIM